MDQPSGSTPGWQVDAASGDQSYRFTNLQDHSAWRVVIQGDNGFTAAISHHVGYGRGWFCQRLQPGRYSLTWDSTVSMLPPRAGEAPRPKLRSAAFDVPLEGASPLELPAD